MAGVRHHILPRFLLKGFASKNVGHEVFTWVHRKDGNVFEANIKNVSVERHFYGKDGDPNVDDDITDIEPAFAAMLDELRGKEDGSEITDPRLPEFVTHLSSRTKHLRDSFIETSEDLLVTFTRYFADPGNFEMWARDYYKRHPEVITKAVKEALQKMELTRPQRLVLRRRFAKMGLDSLVSQLDLSQQALMFGMVGPEVIKKLPTIVRDGHIKALARSLVPEARVEQYENLNWVVFKSGQPLILGDVGCLFELSGKTRFVSSSGKDDDLRNVFLPISSDTLVIGTALNSIGDITIEAINLGIVGTSRDFFVCCESSAETKDLQRVLGEDSGFFNEAEMQQLVKEVILEA